jgi:sugar/nucleoside kinase (ribokinase family)
MTWDVVGLGNALMDALVVVNDDSLIKELGLRRGTMHPVGHARWTEIYERLQGQRVTFESGGSCANTIAAVGLLGGKALYRGQVGDDQMGKMYAGRITEACGGHALAFAPNQPTGKCLSIISGPDAERTMVTDLGTSTALDHLGELAQPIQDTKVAHFTGYTLLGGAVRQTALEGIALASETGATVSVDAADPFVVLQTRDLLWSLLEQYTDIVFLNTEEAEQLTKLGPIEAARHIAERANVRTVVVKLGSRGSVVLHEGALFEIGIRKVHAVDTTGAGDAYAGGFLYGLTHGWPIAACGHLGSAIAGATVAQIGAVVKNREALAAIAAEIKAERMGDDTEGTSAR